MDTSELYEKILSRVEKTASGCWEWAGSKTRNGYGDIAWNCRRFKTHRAVFEHVKGPVPPGLQLDHLCRNRACCNPDHLEAVTPRENCMRGISFAAKHAERASCARAGHPLSGDNLVIEHDARGRPRRRCRACRRAASVRFRQSRAREA